MPSTLVVIEGSLAGDPQIKQTSGGKTLANFELAVPNGYGKSAKDPFVFKVTAWSELAEQVAQLQPGTKLTMYGRLTSRTYDWNGQTKTATDIVANSLDVRTESVQKPAARQQRQEEIDPDSIPF